MDAATHRIAYERHRSRALEYERKFVQHARRAELHRIAFGAPPPPPPPSKMQGRVDTLETARTDAAANLRAWQRTELRLKRAKKALSDQTRQIDAHYEEFQQYDRQVQEHTSRQNLGGMVNASMLLSKSVALFTRSCKEFFLRVRSENGLYVPTSSVPSDVDAKQLSNEIRNYCIETKRRIEVMHAHITKICKQGDQYTRSTSDDTRQKASRGTEQCETLDALLVELKKLHQKVCTL